MYPVWAAVLTLQICMSCVQASTSATTDGPTTTPPLPGAPYFVATPNNATVLVEKPYKLHCQVRSEEKVKTRWWHYYDQIKKRSNFHRILKNGDLKFHRIMPQHQGYYYCKVNNSVGTVQSKLAYLRVHAPATILEGPSSKRVKEGETVVVQCMVGGDPEPRITWHIDGRLLVIPNTRKIYNKQEYKFNATRTQRIECTAENTHVEGNTSVSQHAIVHVIETPRGYCQAYEGRLCRVHIGNRPVFYNLTSPSNVSDIQEMSTYGQWKRLMMSVSDACRESVLALLCEMAFPACINSTKLPTKVPVCREQCEAIESYFCTGEWQTVSNIFNSAGVYLPPCSDMPSIHSNPQHHHSNQPQSHQQPTCTQLEIFKVQPSQVTTSCYHGDGRYYQGPVNVTEHLYPCQSWAASMPHIHPFLTPANFPVLWGAGAECRNPGGLRAAPWCYLDSSGTGPSWQYCDIPVCAVNQTTSGKAREGRLLQRLESYPPEIIVVVAVVALVSVSLVVLVVTVLYCLCRQRIQSKYDRAYQSDMDIDVEKLQSNECFNQSVEHLGHSILRTFEYPRNDIVFMKDIGLGAFGKVFQAKAPNITKGQESTVVVVKMLKDGASDEMRLNFEREAGLLVELSHPNIIKLLGACAIGKPMCLLFEYMGKGDLNGYLRNCSPDRLLLRNRSTDALSPPCLTILDKLKIGEQICSAMVYLSSQGYIHRDLATRNCLVGNELQVKISDFSLVRSVDKAGLYNGNDDDEVPVRWMPLEAIMYNRFSVGSDVWSYGVVLWEIFSHAQQPYHDMQHEEILKFIHEGQILSCPAGTPESVYDLMEICWDMDADGRPLFEEIVTMLDSIRDKLEQGPDSDDSSRDKV